MTPEERKELLKEISFAIGLCASVKAERKAEVALEVVEKFYKLEKK
jgi:hypothetical protein